MPASFTCPVCGEVHDELLDLVADAPLAYLGIPDEERDRRTSLTTDTCIIDDAHFFIRGIIEIPIDDYPERFGFNVWVSQSRASFEAYVAHGSLPRWGITPDDRARTDRSSARRRPEPGHLAADGLHDVASL